MGFRTNTHARIWSVEPGRGKFTKVNLSVSRKNKETGQYETDFSDYCMFIGEAHAKAALLKRGDRIKLGDVDVSNRYDKATEKKYVDYKVFSFDLADAAGDAPAQRATNDTVANDVESDEGDLPF